MQIDSNLAMVSYDSYTRNLQNPLISECFEEMKQLTDRNSVEIVETHIIEDIEINIHNYISS